MNAELHDDRAAEPTNGAVEQWVLHQRYHAAASS
jgi:hypothetical protein